MINPAWAQAAPGGAPPAVMQFAPLVLIFVVFYFLLIRPQQQKAKEHKTMLSNLKRNDDVITTGGIYGKIMALTDKVVTLEIAKQESKPLASASWASAMTSSMQRSSCSPRGGLAIEL